MVALKHSTDLLLFLSANANASGEITPPMILVATDLANTDDAAKTYLPRLKQSLASLNASLSISTRNISITRAAH